MCYVNYYELPGLNKTIETARLLSKPKPTFQLFDKPSPLADGVRGKTISYKVVLGRKGRCLEPLSKSKRNYPPAVYISAYYGGTLMNSEERRRWKELCRKRKWAKGKKLTKQDLEYISEEFHSEVKPKKQENWQPASNPIEAISDILSKMPINKQKGGKV